MLQCVIDRGPFAAGILALALALTGCGSGSGHSAGPSPTTGTSRATGITGPVPGLPTCPTRAQVDKALGTNYGAPIRTQAGGGGIVCEYSGVGKAAVTIFAAQSPAVFAGQVSNAGKAPGMRKIIGVGDGAFAVNSGGRSIVNAYSRGGRTFVAAQAPGPLGPTEALARIALSDN
jgi:hypothetical protein